MLNFIKQSIKKAYHIGYEKGLVVGYKLGRNRVLTAGQDQPRSLLELEIEAIIREEEQDGQVSTM